LKAFWGPPGSFLGTVRELVEALWEPSQRPWGPFGSLLVVFFESPLGAFFCGAFSEPFGSLVGAFWKFSGSLLDDFWRINRA